MRNHCPIFFFFFFNFLNTGVNLSLATYGTMTRSVIIAWELKPLLYPGKDLQHDDINFYADNIFSTIDTIARECIPNKNVRIKVTDPPWITSGGRN